MIYGRFRRQTVPVGFSRTVFNPTNGGSAAECCCQGPAGRSPRVAQQPAAQVGAAQASSRKATCVAKPTGRKAQLAAGSFAEADTGASARPKVGACGALRACCKQACQRPARLAGLQPRRGCAAWRQANHRPEAGQQLQKSIF